MTIVTDILKQRPAVNQPQRKFLAVLFATILALRGRVTGRNLGRYCEYSERTIARQFRASFDWPDFHQRVMTGALDPRSELVSAQDASFIPKSGKQTFGLGHFFNGCASRVERGLEIATLAVVDVTHRCAFTLAVTLTVSDGTLSSQCTGAVTVVDGQAPALTCPGNQTATATSASGAVVNFSVTATDNCPTVMTTCTPPSGSTFPLGSTSVTCTVTDGAGLQNSCSFSVTVTANALTQLNGLISTVQGLPVPSAVKLALKAPLLVAKAALEHNQPQVACGSLRVFEGIVKQLRQANKLTAAQATQLTSASQGIRATIGCP